MGMCRRISFSMKFCFTDEKIVVFFTIRIGHAHSEIILFIIPYNPIFMIRTYLADVCPPHRFLVGQGTAKTKTSDINQTPLYGPITLWMREL